MKINKRKSPLLNDQLQNWNEIFYSVKANTESQGTHWLNINFRKW